MSKNDFIPEQFKTGTICIDSYEGKTFRGRLWYPCFDKEKHFDNLMQMIESIDTAVKTIGFPDEFSQTRSFSQTAETGNEEISDCGGDLPENGKLATFRIKIVFLQNTTWQGVVTWVEKNEEESFRSMRELIYLMDSAIA